MKRSAEDIAKRVASRRLKNPSWTSEKEKERLRTLNIGRKERLEHKEKRRKSLLIAFSNPQFKTKLSAVRRQQYKNGFTGSLGKHWKKTPEQLANKMGAKNPAWKGGITPLNTKIRNSEEYATWRKAVFERDDYRCFGCGIKSIGLEAHHIYPFALFPRLRLEVQNGITYCENCHAIMDKQKAKFVKVTLN